MPTSGTPATRSLVDEIRDRLKNGDLSPFELATFKKMADALKATDTDNAFDALGILACVEKNVAACRKNHEKAILVSVFPSIHISNYANSMLRLGLNNEAIALAQRARSVDMANMTALDIAINASFNLGDEERYLGFIEEWKKNKGEDHPSYAAYLEERREANELTSCCMHGASDSLEDASA